eukprot:8788015-Pyramimonas_sp.AAC.1
MARTSYFSPPLGVLRPPSRPKRPPGKPNPCWQGAPDSSTDVIDPAASDRPNSTGTAEMLASDQL